MLHLDKEVLESSFTYPGGWEPSSAGEFEAVLVAGQEPEAAAASGAGSGREVQEQHMLVAWSWGLWDLGYLKKRYSAGLYQQNQLCSEFHQLETPGWL